MAAGRQPARELVLVQPRAQPLAHHHGSERYGAAADPLGQRHDVGHDVPVLAAEPPSGAPEPGHHLVEDEQDAVPVADLTDGGEVARRRDEHAVGAGHRLQDHRGDGLGPLVLQDLLEVRAAGGDAAGVGVAGGGVERVCAVPVVQVTRGAAVRIRVEHAHDPGHGGLRRPAPRVAGEGRGACRRPVVAPVPGDDLLAPGHPARQLHGVLVGVGAARGEQRQGEVARRHLGEQPGELGPRLAGERRRQAAQRARLAPHRLDQARMLVPEVEVDDLGGEVEVPATAVVPEPASLAAGHAQRVQAALRAPGVDDVLAVHVRTLSRPRGACTAAALALPAARAPPS